MVLSAMARIAPHMRVGTNCSQNWSVEGHSQLEQQHRGWLLVAGIETGKEEFVG